MKKFPTNLYNIPGYYRLVCCRSSKNAGGGLLIFIKRNIITLNVKTQSSSFEKIVFNAKLGSKCYKIINYYRPPKSENLKEFLEDLENELNCNDERIILTGDINIHPKDDSRDSKLYLNVLSSFDMSILNDEIIE